MTTVKMLTSVGQGSRLPTGASPDFLTPYRAHLRVGVIAPPFLPVPPNGYGGIERVVAGLVEELVARDHVVTLFAAPGSRTKAHLVCPLSEVPPLGSPDAANDDLYHSTTAYLRVREFDVVHDHSGTGPALGAMQSGRVPVVCTLHGPWTVRSRRFFALVHERIHLVAISEAQRRANPSLRYAGVVRNGIDLNSHIFRPAKEDFLVFVGRISPEKRPEVAVEVAERAGLPLFMLIKRTEAIEQRYWREVVEPKIGPNVIVLDEPEHQLKVELIGRARAMLFPLGWEEPFGLVMAESMACGTPVITNPKGAAPEVVRDGTTGFLCDSVEEMVEAVSSATRIDPEDCRAHVIRNFSSQAMVSGYEQIYAEVTSHAMRAS